MFPPGTLDLEVAVDQPAFNRIDDEDALSQLDLGQNPIPVLHEVAAPSNQVKGEYRWEKLHEAVVRIRDKLMLHYTLPPGKTTAP